MIESRKNREVYEKEKFIIEEAGHAQAAGTNPELYWNTVEQFIKKYIDK